MWLMQLLAGLIPTVGVGMPLVWYMIRRPKFKQKTIELTEVRAETKAIEGGSLTSISASVKSTSSGSKRSKVALIDSPEYKAYTGALEQLERRAIENQNYKIYGLLENLLEEFRDLSRKLLQIGLDHQSKLAYVKYTPVLGKLIDLTSMSNYGDFVRNPDHWEDPERKRHQVELAVLAVAQSASDDIRRLNRSQELNFKVNVETIIGKAGALDTDEDSADMMQELLSDPASSIEALGGDLESLKVAVNSEAAILEERRAKEEAKTLEEISQSQAGSKAELELKAKLSGKREVVAHKRFLKQEFNLYGKGEGSDKYLVAYSNDITGEVSWKEFKQLHEAADHIDDAMAVVLKDHSFNCDCIYCRD